MLQKHILLGVEEEGVPEEGGRRKESFEGGR